MHAVVKRPFRTADLEPLFQPRHIAVIGASRSPGKQGYAVVRNLVRCGFPGAVYPINPAGGEIEGLKCYASIADAPKPIDCAIVVVPPDAAVQAVRELGEAGVKAAVVAASGFAEIGTPEGKARQDALTEVARATGMRIVGPNTNGICNVTGKLSLGYNATHGDPIKPGIISIASHSGALFGGLVRDLDRLGFGISKFVPVGNEADLDMLDFLEYFVEDPATQVIGLLIEALSDGQRFSKLAARAHQSGKSIVALKVGRLAAGVGAALAHSSRLAGSARAYDALFRACGVASVRSVEALTGGCAVLASRASQTVRGDQSLVCVASSGAGGAMTVDFAGELGIRLAGDGSGEWGKDIAADLAPIKSLAPLRNPIDIGSFGPAWGRLADVYGAIEKHGLTGPTVVYAHIAPTPDMDDGLLDALVGRKERTGTPIALNAPGALTEQVEARYRERGIPVFHDTATCLASLNCHYTAQPPAIVDAGERNRTSTSTDIRKALSDGASDFLPETASAALLRQAGLPMVDIREVNSLEEAIQAGVGIGYPLVLKALAPGVSHKAKQGHVVTDIAEPAALEREYFAMERRLEQQGYARADVPFILQPMIGHSKAELILGISNEQGLGHFLVVGLGGIHTEILDEVALFPVSEPLASIRSGLESTRVGALLTTLGKGLAGRDLVGEVVASLGALQSLAHEAGDILESIDINPLLVTANGLVAVDALIVPKRKAA